MVNVVYDARRYNFLICYSGAISYFRLHIINDVKQKWPGWVVPSNFIWLATRVQILEKKKNVYCLLKQMKQTMWKSKQMKIIAIQARLGSTKGHIFKYIFLWDEKLKCKVYCLLFIYLFFSLVGVQEIITLIKWITTHDKRWWEKFL